MKNKKLFKVIISSFIFGLFTFIFSLSLKVNAADGAIKPENCKCDDDCPFCKVLCTDEYCYCYLVYIVIALLIVTMFIGILKLFLNYRQNRLDKEEENEKYNFAYAKMMEEQDRRKKEQDIIEAKLNGESGFEDLVFQLATDDTKDANEILLDFLDGTNIDPEDVTIEFESPNSDSNKDN